MGTKICNKCNQTKNTNDYYRHHTNKDGLDGKCKQCAASYIAKWQKENREKRLQHKQNYRNNNKEAIRKYREKNKEHLKQKAKEYRKMREKNDTSYKIKVNLRRKIRRALHGETKSDHAMELIGCSMEYFIKYFEGQFRDGMDWSNYGYYGWHIDHIIPCSYFDLSKPEQQKICFHYTNLQPLWGTENMSKSNKL